MSAADVAGKSFKPPKWCRVPREPARRRQVLSFTREDGSGTATPQPIAEVSDKAIYTIGRGDISDVRLRGDLASRLHAAVLQDAEGQKYLVDLKSTHGTFLDAKKLAPHTPVKWATGVLASFGSGPKAEVIVLGPPPPGDGSGADIQPAKRAKTANGASSGGVNSKGGGSDGADTAEALGNSDPLASLYDGLPEAVETEYIPKPEVPRFEPLPPADEDPTKIVFLDVDGVLRPLHSRQDAFQNARTIDIGGARVPLLGNSEAKAGIDFWPSAMRALRHVVQKTGARLVLSSDWRKEDVLKDGIASALEEYRMPSLYGSTPDLDQVTLGVIKALHTSFREKRCKEIRKWLSRHPKVTNWVAVDDVDLSLPDKEAQRDLQASMRSGGMVEVSVFLDPSENFVRTNPQFGLTMELARLAVCLLNGLEITQEHIDAAYGSTE